MFPVSELILTPLMQTTSSPVFKGIISTVNFLKKLPFHEAHFRYTPPHSFLSTWKWTAFSALLKHTGMTCCPGGVLQRHGFLLDPQPTHINNAHGRKAQFLAEWVAALPPIKHSCSTNFRTLWEATWLRGTLQTAHTLSREVIWGGAHSLLWTPITLL